MSAAGFDVVVMLAASFRAVISDLHRDLAEHGHPAARPVHGFALQAIGPEGCTISELGQRLGVTKQAAAKTARSLEEAGYVSRRPDPADARAVRLSRTEFAQDLLERSESFFEGWSRSVAERVGGEHFATAVDVLRVLSGNTPFIDLPGWLEDPR